MEIQTSLFRENAISILKKKIIKSTTHVHLSTDEAKMIYEVLACECKCKELNLTNCNVNITFENGKTNINIKET